MKWAITEKFKDYLTGAKFVVFTDSNPVAHLQAARLRAVEQRWLAQLASFDFKVAGRTPMQMRCPGSPQLQGPTRGLPPM